MAPRAGARDGLFRGARPHTDGGTQQGADRGALPQLVGEPIVRAIGGALGPIAIAAVGLAGLGVAGWILITRRRRGPGALPPLAVVGDWADACCPACLTLAVIEARRPG